MPKPSVQTNGKKELPDFFKKNKSLIVLLPVLALGIVAVIILYAKPGTPKKPVSASTPPKTTVTPEKKNNETALNGNNVEILPQMERVTKPELPAEGDIRDPFASEKAPPVMTLKGIAFSGDKSTAVIETEDRAYVVSAGDKVAEQWNVVKIEPQSVTLQDIDGNSIILEF